MPASNGVVLVFSLVFSMQIWHIPRRGRRAARAAQQVQRASAGLAGGASAVQAGCAGREQFVQAVQGLGGSGRLCRGAAKGSIAPRRRACSRGASAG